MLAWMIFLLIGGALLGCAAIIASVIFVAILFGCLKGCFEASKLVAGFSRKSKGCFSGKAGSASEGFSNADLSLN